MVTGRDAYNTVCQLGHTRVGGFETKGEGTELKCKGPFTA